MFVATIIRGTLGVAVCAVPACGSTSRDSIAPSTHVQVSEPAPPRDGYEHVVQRDRVTLGLAEARGFDSAWAKEFTERLADRTDACVRSRADRGASEEGAARAIVVVETDGQVVGSNVTSSPGTQATAVECLLAPLRASSFPPGPAPQGARRGMAIEASWRMAPPQRQPR